MKTPGFRIRYHWLGTCINGWSKHQRPKRVRKSSTTLELASEKLKKVTLYQTVTTPLAMLRFAYLL
ncbi:hypothetical protein N7501_000619 [Penicillium viridicatum]|nr:hypothetical protein N7501_000619 [Penicillium viridicatum]